MKNFQYIIVIMILLSCNKTKTKLIEKERSTIEVKYFLGPVEPYTSINCESFKEDYKTEDTIYIGKRDFVRIKNSINKLKPCNLDNCDVKMSVMIDSTYLCVGQFNCLLKDGKSVMKDDSLVYLIKSLSNYYNYFEKENLEYLPEIKEFGIPAGYHYQKKKFKQMFTKVVLISKD